MNDEHSFNIEKFLNRMDRIFPEYLRTTENLNKIVELATLNNLSELDMKKYVQRAINFKPYQFEMESLENLILKNSYVSVTKIYLTLNDVSLGKYTISEIMQRLPEWIKDNEQLNIKIVK